MRKQVALFSLLSSCVLLHACTVDSVTVADVAGVATATLIEDTILYPRRTVVVPARTIVVPSHTVVVRSSRFRRHRPVRIYHHTGASRHGKVVNQRTETQGRFNTHQHHSARTSSHAVTVAKSHRGSSRFSYAGAHSRGDGRAATTVVTSTKATTGERRLANKKKSVAVHGRYSRHGGPVIPGPDVIRTPHKHG